MRAASAARAEAARVTMLECGFDLDVGGTTVAPAEAHSHAVKRIKLRRVPDYDSFSDPHLIKFWRQRRRSSSVSQAEQLRSTSPRSSRSREGDVTSLCTPASAEHVLALKRVFFRFSEEFRGCMCKAEHCIAKSAGGVSRETARIASVTHIDILGVVKFGIGVSNHFRLMTHVLPLSTSPTRETLDKWLRILSCTAVVDWPSFLLLTTVDLVRDLPTAIELYEAFTSFSMKRQIRTEDDFCDLLSYLVYTRCGHEAKPTTFFQPSDCYKARHSCNFAEILFSLMPHNAQFYLSKANARGYTLSTNNCGHSAIVTNNNSPTPPRGTSPTKPSSRRRPLTAPIIDGSRNVRAESLQRQAKTIRYQTHVFL